jgi:hypothetical protein
MAGLIIAGFIIWPAGAIIGAIIAGFIIWPMGAIIGAIMAGFIIMAGLICSMPVWAWALPAPIRSTARASLLACMVISEWG